MEALVDMVILSGSYYVFIPDWMPRKAVTRRRKNQDDCVSNHTHVCCIYRPQKILSDYPMIHWHTKFDFVKNHQYPKPKVTKQSVLLQNHCVVCFDYL